MIWKAGLIFLVVAGLAAKKRPANQAPVDPATKVRVFVGESESFISSAFGTAAATNKSAHAVSSSSATMEKMTVLVMKALNDKCPRVIVVNQPDKADYFLRLDRNGVFVRSNAMAVFNKVGEMVFADAGVNLTKEVKKFCSNLPPSAASEATETAK